MKTVLTDVESTSYVQTPPEGLGRRMSYEGILNKSALMFVVLLAFAALAWFAGPTLWIPLAVGGSICALILGLVLAFKKEPSVPLTVMFTIAEGLTVGAFSAAVNSITQGLVFYAVLATLATFTVVLVMFRSGKLRMTPKLTKILAVACLGYLLFSLLNFALTAFNVLPGMGMRDIEVFGIPLGIPLGILAVLLASAALVMDFDNAKRGVEAGLESKYEWVVTYSLIATIVWMYVEYLRLFSYLSRFME